MFTKGKEKDSIIQTSDTFTSLLSWGRSKGIYFSDKLHYPCSFSPGYPGTVALSEISPEELLISIPNSLIMSHKLTDDSSLQSFFSENLEFFSLPKRENEDYRMMAFILLELSKGSASPWAEYLASWPSHVETIADWKEVELVQLQDSDFVNDAIIRKEWNHSVCKELAEVFAKYPELFLDKFASQASLLWIWNIMTTRCFGGGLPYSSLIPLADFLNHSNGPTVYYYGKLTDPAPDSACVNEEDLDDDLIDESDCIKLTMMKLHKINMMAYSENQGLEGVDEELGKILKECAGVVDAGKKNVSKESPAEELEENFFQIRSSRTERYEEGAQVTISYGNYSNRMLLTNYGFAINDNIYDYARIKFPLKGLLKECQFEKLIEKYDNPLCVAFKFKSTCLNLEFLNVIRGILWTPDLPAQSFIEPISLSLEREVFQYAIELLETQLEEFETSLEEDEEMIKKNPPHRMYFSVTKIQLIYRIGVKKSIKGQIKLFKLVQKVLDLVSQNHDLSSYELGEGNSYIDLEINWEGLEKYTKTLKISSNPKISPA